MDTINEVQVSNNVEYFTTTLGHTTWDNWTTGTYYYGSYIYLYQIKCPKKTCGTYNWLQLDIIKPCSNCGAKLKAVNNQPDYEIPVNS